MTIATTHPTAPLPAPAVAAVARPVRTVNYHLAHMRCAQLAAQQLMDDRLDGQPLDGDEHASRDAEKSYYLLAAAHRSAARRLERGERVRSRVEQVVRPVVRAALRMRRVVTR
jgi:hypothetical protein